MAQIVERFGIPPRTPALDQSIGLAGSIIPDRCCALVEAGTTRTNASATGPTPGFQRAFS